MRLRGEIVDLVGLHIIYDTRKIRSVTQIAVVKSELGIRFVRVLIDVIDPLSVNGGGAAFDAMNFIAFPQQKFGKIGSILPGNSGNESAFNHFCDSPYKGLSEFI